MNDKPLPTVFGNNGLEWNWQPGETLSVENEGERVTVALHDLTGFDGRADALAFVREDVLSANTAANMAANTAANTTEDKSADAADAAKIENKTVSAWLDAEYQAWSKAMFVPEDALSEPFDLVVVGGGLAGTCAAITAAREGLVVALVQNRPVLGGNSSTEIRVHLHGKIFLPPWPNLGKLTDLMGPFAGESADVASFYKDQDRLALVQAEKNLHLYLSTHVVQADVTTQEDGSRLLTAVYGRHIETGKILRFRGKLFADCTGDGTVGFLSGADWRMGREQKSLTSEELAPEESDGLTMGASLLWNSTETDAETTFPELPWAIPFTEETIRPSTRGAWNWEAGFELDQITDIEQIRDIGLRAVYGHWSYLKNHADGKWAERVKNRKLDWVSYISGKRESRRLMGDLILTQQDMTTPILYDDAAVTSEWPIDLHYAEKKNKEAFPGQEFRAYAEHVKIAPYPIPYRCFYSRNVNNLFMAGRNISVTHIALGSVRVMRTGGMMGEVVGMAAGICRRHDILPRDVYTKYLDELKTLMDRGVMTPGEESKNAPQP